ncbi:MULTISPECIES: DUF3889 domain-containing protein [unclassified Paenibacillus]|uniref:DUF3889 domain-containing protein n=1 Tax=unclassified Paenibacillus TaxID=185978 RepID=UPI0036D371FD
MSMSNPEGLQAIESANALQVQYAVPGNVKWGKLVMEETAKRYNGVDIVDYKYEGRTVSRNGQAEERFVLWLNREGKSFGVRVTVTVQENNDSLVSVHLNELK